MIRRILLPLTVLAALVLTAGVARASGDFTCAPDWKLGKTLYSDCDNLPFLSPANDSRVNLTLLLLDAGRAELGPPPKVDPPTLPIDQSAQSFTLADFATMIGPRPPGAPDAGDSSDDFASGEGSRCRSNAAGAAAFEAALVASASVPAAERALLVEARKAISPNCDDTAKAAAYQPPGGIASPLGKQFARYLAGTAEFYAGDFDDARGDFTAAAAASSQSWLRETARYMLGRVALNKAQVGAFDEFGALSTDKVDATALAQADTAFQAYLKDFPAGQYAASARGLLRRLAWLGGRKDALSADYVWSFAHPGAAQRNVSVGELVFEADNKLLTQAKPADIPDPMLLAARDMMAMRRDPSNAKPDPTLISYADLEAQKAAFVAAPGLFDYLLAAHRFYVEADPAGALARLGPAQPPTGPIDNLAFSRLALRGLALEAQKNYVGARALWLRLLPLARPAFQRPMLDLALAYNEERDGRLAEIFAAGSPVRDPQVRQILLQHDAGPALLIQQAKDTQAAARERRTARYVLLYKDVMRGRYAAFAADAALVVPAAPPPADPSNPPTDPEPDPAVFGWAGRTDDGYACESLRQLVVALAAAPAKPHNALCLGEFVRHFGFEANELNAGAPADQLGGVASQFPGHTFARFEAYKAIIADPKASAGDRAYALYRAVNCYAPAGINECGGKDVPQKERAGWFHTLKTDYPGSEWAQALKYYW